MTEDFVALTLDEEVVLLHPDRVQLIVLDPWAKQVWQHCDGHTTEDLVKVLAAPVEHIQQTLQTLTGKGVIRYEGNRWVRSQTRWV